MTGQLAFPFPQLLAKNCPPFVLLLPEIGSILVPVFAELGREGLGQQEESDVIASGAEVFRYQARLAVGLVRALAMLSAGATLIRHMTLDIMVVPRRRGKERDREREEK